MAVYGYCRVSTARQASEGESLDVQRPQIEGYAHMHGLTLRGVTVDEGVSGSIPVNERPKGGPLFAKLRKGDIVIAPKLDRLFRSALDALQVVEDLRKRGVSLHLLDLGGDISGNGLSKLFLTIARHSLRPSATASANESGRSRLTRKRGAAISAALCRSAIVAVSMAYWRRMKPSRQPSARWWLCGLKERRCGPSPRRCRPGGFKISHEGVKGVLAAHSTTA
jgi:hypothetical protein